jgi:hypothetical protein
MRMLSSIVVASILLSGSALAADGGPARPKAPHGAKVMILSPRDGATVGPDVTVKFGVKGIALKPATDPAPDSGHHHLLIDQKELPPLDAPIPNDATHKHYGKAQTEDTIHLEPGVHVLQLDFGDAAHMQFDPPIVSKKISITVEGAKP